MGNPAEFADIIAKALKKQSVTSEKLAELIGVRPPHLSAAKRGDRPLPDSACERLAELAEEDFGRVIKARMRQRGWTMPLMMITLFVVTTFVSSLAFAAQPCGSSATKIMQYTLCVFQKKISRIQNKILAAATETYRRVTRSLKTAALGGSSFGALLVS